MGEIVDGKLEDLNTFMWSAAANFALQHVSECCHGFMYCSSVWEGVAMVMMMYFKHSSQPSIDGVRVCSQVAGLILNLIIIQL